MSLLLGLMSQYQQWSTFWQKRRSEVYLEKDLSCVTLLALALSNPCLHLNIAFPYLIYPKIRYALDEVEVDIARAPS